MPITKYVLQCTSGPNDTRFYMLNGQWGPLADCLKIATEVDAKKLQSTLANGPNWPSTAIRNVRAHE